MYIYMPKKYKKRSNKQRTNKHRTNKYRTNIKTTKNQKPIVMIGCSKKNNSSVANNIEFNKIIIQLKKKLFKKSSI